MTCIRLFLASDLPNREEMEAEGRRNKEAICDTSGLPGLFISKKPFCMNSNYSFLKSQVEYMQTYANGVSIGWVGEV